VTWQAYVLPGQHEETEKQLDEAEDFGGNDKQANDSKDKNCWLGDHVQQRGEL
jgi:hypothetical protein